jgi:hypothetical protein
MPKNPRSLLVFVSIALMFTFAKDLFFPSHESQSLGLNLITLLLRVGMVVGLVGLSIQISKEPSTEGGSWKMWSGLGLLAAFGMLVLQLSGPSSKRLSAPVAIAAEATPTMTPAPGINYNQLFAKMHLIGRKPECQAKAFEVNGTVWVMDPGSNAFHPQKITRTDLHDYNEKMSELLAAIDHVLEAAAVAAASEMPKEEERLWRADRAMVSNRYEQTKLLEANWDEWHLSGIKPKTGEAKPWQKEAARLQSEIDAAPKKDEGSSKVVRLSVVAAG